MRSLPFVCLMLGCGPVTGTPPTGDAGPDAPGPVFETVVESRATPIRDLDVLFVIDDSSSMLDKQQTLTDNFPVFVNELSTIPGGLPDLHLGVITTDMGTKGSGSPNPAPGIGAVGQGGCSNTGKSGNLQMLSTQVTGNFVSDIKLPDGTRQQNYSNGSLATVFGTMAKVGANGCGFEQPLHAMRSALDNNATNAGFLRPAALLAVVFLTDEDDCSVRDTSLFSANEATLGALQSFRCTRFGVTCGVNGETSDDMNVDNDKGDCGPSTDPASIVDQVAPFRDFLVGLKDDSSKVIVGGIIGPATPVAVELRAPPGGGPALPAVAHSCSVTVNGMLQVADPGVRMQAFLDLFPNRNASGSICETDFSEALRQVAQTVAVSSGTPCVGKPILDVDANMPGIQADCIVEDVLGTNVTVIQPCDAVVTPTCWRLVSDAETCPLFDQLRLEVVRDVTLDPDTVTRARCRVQ
jgi:hypothetical protein